MLQQQHVASMQKVVEIRCGLELVKNFQNILQYNSDNARVHAFLRFDYVDPTFVMSAQGLTLKKKHVSDSNQ